MATEKKLKIHSPGKAIAALAIAQNTNRVSVIQQLSMRSHEDGLYNIIADGNIWSNMHIMYVASIYYRRWVGGELLFKITLPKNDRIAFGVKAVAEIQAEFKKRRLNVAIDQSHDYGENARDNRRVLAKIMLEDDAVNFTMFNHVIDNDYELEPKHGPVVAMIPGSPRPENTQYSMEEFDYFQHLITHADVTFFHNQNQAQVFDWTETSFITENVISPIPITLKEVLNDELLDVQYYFPYRISDDDYNFDAVLASVPEGSTIAITDPNEVYGKLRTGDIVYDEEYPNIKLKKLNPYYHKDYVRQIISATANARAKDPSPRFRYPIKIVVSNRMSETIHMGPAEIYSAAKVAPYEISRNIFHYVGTTEAEFFYESSRMLGQLTK